MRVMGTENKVQKEVAEMSAGEKISGGSSDTKTRNMGWIDRDQASQKKQSPGPHPTVWGRACRGRVAGELNRLGGVCWQWGSILREPSEV